MNPKQLVDSVKAVLRWTALGLVTSCGPVMDANPSAPPSSTESSAAPSAYPGILKSSERPLATPCAFSAGTINVFLNGGEQVTLTLDGSKNILVNGSTCGAATATNTTRINVGLQTAQTSDETVILDFSNGLFGTAAATSGQGIFVSLGAGNLDAVQVLGTAGADTFTLGTQTGSDYLALNTDTFKDVTLTGVELFTFSLGDGDDRFSGGGSLYGTGQAFSKALALFGGAGNDNLTGGSAADDLHGGDGNDTLVESAGDDLVDGELGDDLFDEGPAANGADTLVGSAGIDTVSYAARTVDLDVSVGSGANDGAAGEGDDVRSSVEVVLGGAGNDTLACEASTACTLDGGAGADWLKGRNGNDTLRGGAGDDLLSPGAGDDLVDGQAGVDTVTYADRSVAVTVTLGTAGTPTVGNGVSGENDSIDNVENIVGGSGADLLTGNAGANRITGGAGADTLVGGAGNDVFYEGTGPSGGDSFAGGAGEDTVDYGDRSGALTVTMDGLSADDGQVGEADNVAADVENLIAGAGADSISGNALDNKIDGGGGADTLSGGAGNDELTGGAGMDTLNGEAGDDTLDAGADGAVCDCGAGFDISINATSSLSCEVT